MLETVLSLDSNDLLSKYQGRILRADNIPDDFYNVDLQTREKIPIVQLQPTILNEENQPIEELTNNNGRGNFAFGVKEQIIFPEINYDKVDTIKGMNIVFTTTAKTDEEAAALLELLGMPFEKQEGIMAKTSLKVKQQRKPKYSTRAYTRCRLCGRPHSVLRKYGICRICFRELAYKGEIPGVRKASW